MAEEAGSGGSQGLLPVRVFSAVRLSRDATWHKVRPQVGPARDSDVKKKIDSARLFRNRPSRGSF